jgi:polar amino acid transport system permease protein
MFDASVIIENASLLWQGLLITLLYTVTTIATGLVIGFAVGLVQLSRLRPLRICGRLYVEFFRNIPLLVIPLWACHPASGCGA